MDEIDPDKSTIPTLGILGLSVDTAVALPPHSPVALQIERGGRLMYVSFSLD